MITTDTMKPGAMLADIISEPYCWPGGYAKFIVCRDGGSLCHECAVSQRENIEDAIADGWPSDWLPAAIDATCNSDGPLDCDHCGAWIIEPFEE